MNSKTKLVRPLLREFAVKNSITILLLFSAVVVSAFMEVYPVQYMQQIIDTVTRDGKFDHVLLLVGLWYGARIVGTLFGYLAGRLSGKLGAELGGTFRTILFDRVSHSQYKDLENVGAADTVTKVLTDIAEIGNAVILPIRMAGQNIITFFWAFIFLLSIDPLLLFASIPLGILMLLLGELISKKNKAAILRKRSSESKMIGVLLEVFGSFREIFVFNLWRREKQKFDFENQQVVSNQFYTKNLTSALYSLTELLWPVATVICLSLGSYRVLQGAISIGELLAFMWYIQWVIHPISQLANFRSDIQSSIVALERVNEMFSLFSGNSKGNATIQQINTIGLQNVSYHHTNNDGVSRINLELQKGKCVAIVGETGCGKSTLLKLLLGLYIPQTGSVLVDGRNICPEQLVGSAAVSVAFSDPYIFNATILDNISLADTASNQQQLLSKALWALEKANLSDFVMTLDASVDTKLGEEGQGISTGQKQRIGVARAFYYLGDLIIFDEATSAIDSNTEHSIISYINEIKTTHIVVIVSHRLASIANADIVYVMKGGQIVSEGKPSELLELNAEYRDLFLDQIK